MITPSNDDVVAASTVHVETFPNTHHVARIAIVEDGWGLCRRHVDEAAGGNANQLTPTQRTDTPDGGGIAVGHVDWDIGAPHVYGEHLAKVGASDHIVGVGRHTDREKNRRALRRRNAKIWVQGFSKIPLLESRRGANRKNAAIVGRYVKVMKSDAICMSSLNKIHPSHGFIQLEKLELAVLTANDDVLFIGMALLDACDGARKPIFDVDFVQEILAVNPKTAVNPTSNHRPIRSS
mmetsp:Transcript_10153/g.23878  ORF Transcript_10153/g.23878 Transcript_10153/m.23878 type:complete len:236 (+) Transcript_10153:258-965(+)